MPFDPAKFKEAMRRTGKTVREIAKDLELPVSNLSRLSAVGTAPNPTINNVEKFVVTGTAPEQQWANSSVVNEDLVEFVTDLKRRPGEDIGVHGSIKLAQSLLEERLVDELRLVIAPAIQITGSRLFDATPSSRLTLTRTITSPTGYLLLDYQVGG